MIPIFNKEQLEAEIFNRQDCKDNFVLQNCLMLFHNNVTTLDIAILIAIKELVRHNEQLQKHCEQLIRCGCPPIYLEK